MNVFNKAHLKENSPLELESSAFKRLSKQFWSLQIGGWLGYMLVVFIAIIRPQFDSPDFNLIGQIINLVVETLSGFCLSLLQWLFIQRVIHNTLKQTLILSFTSAAVLGLVYNIIKLGSYKVIVHSQQWNEAWNMLEFGGWLLFSLATMFVWTSIFFIMFYNSKLQREHEQLLRAQTLAKDAQLEMMRYQLNPHFMFNTMNAISTLILKEENDKASEMLDKLCGFFRYSLEATKQSKSTLKDELDLLGLYLSIEKVRFGKRLKVNFAVDKDVMNCVLPNMLCQPIIENAVKYAVEPSKDGAEITFKAYKSNESLIIKIMDTGQAVKELKRKGFGIGLQNTRSRLEVMFNGECEVILTPNQERGNTVTMTMPYEVNND
ncbi:sensor histidine kinase [Pseudoalteromonas phenolica]|uniref:Signal transduction histidine kinase LytS n=1 Tax=Pseudoalteromonas phenolica TaxID=161398 RepID=A0A0S2K3S7_9GAMM|nr:histidine kinase [Pseudoalteromonas phenolica]ALO42610.1 Signal transduction histidine kinase LytS [Pseudoalteromonas phenolica]MBE0356285.1 two-component system, LytT family, sensor kinase [Pseudoalteromonas phenolica O-BC30]